jgi:hypothetical protein
MRLFLNVCVIVGYGSAEETNPANNKLFDSAGSLNAKRNVTSYEDMGSFVEGIPPAHNSPIGGLRRVKRVYGKLFELINLQEHEEINQERA